MNWENYLISEVEYKRHPTFVLIGTLGLSAWFMFLGGFSVGLATTGAPFVFHLSQAFFVGAGLLLIGLGTAFFESLIAVYDKVGGEKPMEVL